MPAARVILQVSVGLSPDMLIKDKCRSWSYTSDDYERDREQGMVDLAAICDEATRYARSQMNPRSNNYVRLDWIWL
jgi:hypothetical protein